jgi:antitoxin (DNA-binding transcriptional repressor) of toxin-antitoxin stability system
MPIHDFHQTWTIAVRNLLTDGSKSPGRHTMLTMPLERANGRLAEIIDKLPPGEEVVLTRDDQPVATIRAVMAVVEKSRQFGTLKGTIVSVAPDFDAIPEGFEDYLP